MIYMWSNPSLSYADYGGVSENDEEKLQWYDPIMGVPLPASMDDWEPPHLEQYLGDGKKKKATSYRRLAFIRSYAFGKQKSCCGVIRYF